MGVKYVFNPTSGGLDVTSVEEPSGLDTQVQFNDAGAFAGDADLTWNKTAKVLGVGGDIDLDDGGAFSLTLQTITPTANRTISFPDASGTVALIGGTNGQITYNNAGAQAGISTLTTDGTNLTLAGRLTNTYTSLPSAPAESFTGSWVTGGTATTTKPHLLIEPAGTTSTAWSTSGTGLGVNAASGFAGNLLDLQLNGTSQTKINSLGALTVPLGTISTSSIIGAGLSDGSGIWFSIGGNATNIGSLARFESGTLGPRFVSGIGFATSVGSASDVIILRDAANTLAQRNSTNAQTSRVYGTYTDASNYVRAALSSTNTAVTLAAETAGTGADDIPLNLTAAGTGAVKVNSNLEIADTKNIVLATTTGTKIGTATTQKLGFWDKTPVVQPTTGISGATFVADSGGSIHPTSTFDGYTIAQVVAALRQLGILA
jgi:hypothetical protein